MLPPVFAFLDDAKDAVAEFVNNCLLVAGAFLVGYILGGVIGWAVGKFALRQKSPDALKKVGRPVGGVILALIVALMVFTGKGKPRGEGGEGKGNVSPDATNKNAQPEPKVEPRTPPVTAPDHKANETLITVLGGDDVKEGRFYLIGDDRTPKTLEELQKVITERMAKGKVELRIVLLPPPKELPLQHPAITDLQRWAFDKGLGSPPVVKGQ